MMSAVIFDGPAPTVFTARCPKCQQPRRRHLGAGYFMPTGGGCACPEPGPDAVTEVSLAGLGHGFQVANDGTITVHSACDEPEVIRAFTGTWGQFLSAAGFCPDAVLAAVKIEKEDEHV